jgi:hypothetical protein
MIKELTMMHAVRTTRDELLRRLSRLGFERKMLSFRIETGIKTGRTWRAPLDFDFDSSYTGEVLETIGDDPDRFKRHEVPS